MKAPALSHGSRCFASLLSLSLLTFVTPVADGQDVGSRDDLWDVSQGAVVTSTSGVRGGFDAADMFGGANSALEPGQTVLVDDQPPGFVHIVEWQTPVPVSVGTIHVYASGDGEIYMNQREFDRVVIRAKSPGSADYDLLLLDHSPAHPYSFLVPDETLLVNATIPPTIAKDFRAEFTQFTGGMGFDGPRVKELDAFPPDCLPSSVGIVSWWRAQGDPSDSVGDHDGILANGLGFTQGLVGDALDFNASGQHLFIPAADQLAVNSLTIEAWIKPTSLAEQPVIEYSPISGRAGVHLWISVDPEGYQSLPGSLFANVLSEDGVSHLISTGGDIVTPDAWSHVALTYDQNTGLARLFHNGEEVAAEDLGSFVPRTAFPIYVGHRPLGNTDDPNGRTFSGQMDEISIYNRALSPNEIAAIHTAGANGRCVPPPDCASAPEGLIAWWPGEGDGTDAAGTSDGELINGIGFTDGLVGQSFEFTQTGQHLVAPLLGGSPPTSFTMEAWIHPDLARFGEQQPVFEFAQDSGLAGVHFWLSVAEGGGFGSPGTLFANIRSVDGANHVIGTAPNRVAAGEWSHVALTYDSDSGTASIYFNGGLEVSDFVGSFSPQTGMPLYLGYRPLESADGGAGYTFSGKLDEPSLYTRALSATEIAAIHAAGAGGKCLPPTGCEAAREGLIAWWSGEGDATDRIGVHHGTMLGDTGSTSGKVGQGLVFDGIDDAVRIEYSPELVVSSLTVEAWIKPLSLVDDADYGQEIIFGQGFGYPQLCVRNGAQGIRPNLSLAENPSTFLVLESTVEIPVGEFSHLAATWDGSTMKLYVNGMPAGEMVVDRSPVATDCPFFIGGWSDACGFIGHFFHGVIDELSLYNRALSASEIAAIHSAGAAGKCPPPPSLCAPAPEGMLAWWRGEDEVNDELGRHHGQAGEVGYTNSLIGNAMVFDGEGGPVRIPFAESLASSEFSVETWLKPLGPAIDEQWDQDVVFGQALGSPSLLVQPGTEGVRPLFAFMVHPFLTPAVISDVELPIHEFSHVAGTWDGTMLRIYVNGALAGETMPGYVPSGSTCDFYIGGLAGTCAGYAFDGGYFHGVVDELSFYSRALSEAEVNRIYAAGSNGKCPPPGYILSVQTSPGGSVMRDPESAEYRPGQTVTLTALADSGFAFARWEGDATGTDIEIDLLMDADKFLSAIFQDIAAPEIQIVTPAAGVTENEPFVLSGTITDNVAVASAFWEWNGQFVGPLDLVGNEFLIEGLQLAWGENHIRVVVSDAAGNNAAAEVFVEWIPARILLIESPDPVQEGQNLSFPIRLSSSGEVGGASFLLRYDPEYLKQPVLDWLPAVDSALNQVNTDTPGELRATFALPAVPVPQGTQTLAMVTLRSRSVPADLTSILELQLLDISRPTGDSIPYGSAARSGSATILLRRIIGDNNANDRWDAGDGTIIQRLLAGLEPVRLWDQSGNDVNQNTALDSGDVIRVLRAAVGLDPQPTPSSPSPTLATRQPRQLQPMNAHLMGSLTLDADRLSASPGELVTLRVHLTDLSTISAASLRLDYPTNALRLLNSQSHQPGSLVPSSAIAIWNVAPAQTNYSAQSGAVSVAFSSALPWPIAEGALVEFIFEVQEGQSERHQWPIRVSQAEFTADGYDMVALPEATFYFVGRDPLQPQLLPGPANDAGTGFTFSFLGETGLDYTVEVSSDLVDWTPLISREGHDEAITIQDETTAGSRQRYYRVRYE